MVVIIIETAAVFFSSLWMESLLIGVDKNVMGSNGSCVQQCDGPSVNGGCLRVVGCV